MRRVLALGFVGLFATACGEPICSGGTEYDRAERRCTCREPRIWTGSQCVWPSDSGASDAGSDEIDAATVDACIEVELFRDADGDGFGWSADTIRTCGEAPDGYVANDDDCDDGCADCRPGGAETATGVTRTATATPTVTICVSSV